jgi:Na+-driven multidrug efflux pump
MFAAISITFAISLLIYFISNAFASQIVELFIGTDTTGLTPEQAEACLNQSVIYLKRMSLDYLVVSFVFNISGLAMAAGHTWFSLLSGIISSLLFRVPAAIILGITLNYGMAGLGYAAPLASLGALVIGLIYLACGAWKRKNQNVNDIVLEI